MTEPRYSIPKDIPPSAQATEQKLRQIREDATEAEKMHARLALAGKPVIRRVAA